MSKQNPYPLYSDDWEQLEGQREAYEEAKREQYLISKHQRK